MRRFHRHLLAVAVVTLAQSAGAQQTATSTFGEYSRPVTTEHQAAIGRPVTSGVLDFYATEFFASGARNVLGTWGTNDATSVNRPSNLGSATTMFGTQANEEIDIFGRGSNVVVGPRIDFHLHSMDVAHLYSTALSPFALVPFTLTFSGFGPGTGGALIQQSFTIAAPPVINGVQTPFLQTITFDNRWRSLQNVWWFQGAGSGSAHQFTNVNATLVPEPGTYALMLAGLVVVAVLRSRRRA
ncbi:MAG: PEP-CTERM sorting domain-containing protein [Gemmatimonadota bacterium]